MWQLSYPTKHFWPFSVSLPWQYYFNKGYTLTPVFKRQMNASVACRIKANFKCSMRNFEVIQPARSACTFWWIKEHEICLILVWLTRYHAFICRHRWVRFRTEWMWSERTMFKYFWELCLPLSKRISRWRSDLPRWALFMFIHGRLCTGWALSEQCGLRISGMSS